jgi:hypothetical protein
MTRTRTALLAVEGVAVVAILLLLVSVDWVHCDGGDAAGCGMSKGFAAMFAWALAALIGVLALLHLIPVRWLRWTTGVLLVPAVLLALGGVASLVADNLSRAGTIDGGFDLPPADTPEGRYREALRCALLSARYAREDPGRAEFRAEAAWHARRLAADPLRPGAEQLAAWRREEERRLRYPRIESAVSRDCYAAHERATGPAGR